MMPLFWLYIFTLVFYLLLNILIEILTGNIKFELDEEEEELDEDGSLLASLFQLLLYSLAIVSFVVLPAVPKGALQRVLITALIMSVVVEAAKLIALYSGLEFEGIKEPLQYVAKGVVTTTITGIAGYYLMLYVLL